MEQQTGSKLGKEYVKPVYCHPAYLTYMQSTSWEMLDWSKHKLESRLPGEISITSDMQMTPHFGRKQRKTKQPPDESERGEWKSWIKTQQWPQDWKISVFIPIPKKGNAKECSNYRTIAFISHTSKVMLKILQARLQQYVNHEFPDVQAGFRKGKGTRDQIANIHWIIKKAREFHKNIYFCFIDYAKACYCVDHKV